MAIFPPIPTLTNIQGTLPTSKGGTNKTSWTLGSLVYASSSSALDEANSTLFFDGTRLGVGTTRTGAISASNPLARFKGTTADSTTGVVDFQNSAGTELFAVRSDGQIRVAGTNSGFLMATSGVISYDTALAYNSTVGALVLSNYNFRSRQSSNPAWVGSIRDGEIANNGQIGGFRTVVGKTLASDDSNIDAVTAFRAEVKAGDGTETGKGYVTFQTNNGAGALVSALRLQAVGDGHFTRNLCIGDSGITATFGSNGTAVLMLVQGTSPTGNGTGMQLWWDGTNLKYRTPGGTVGNLV